MRVILHSTTNFPSENLKVSNQGDSKACKFTTKSRSSEPCESELPRHGYLESGAPEGFASTQREKD